MEIHLKIIGVILVLVSLMHIGFPKQFNWGEDLKPLSLINRQMMQVHTFFVAFTVLLIGLLSYGCATELIYTAFGRTISLGLALFWGLRFVFQFFVYSSELWRGKRFETIMHIAFGLLWGYVTFIYLTIGLNMYSVE